MKAVKVYNSSHHGETDNFRWYGYSSYGGRTEDQDCCAYHEVNGRYMFAVCDGMGGHAGGRLASTTAAQTLMDAMGRQAEVVTTNEAIVAAVNEANTAVYDKSQEDPGLRGMGTTLTLLVIDSQAAYVTHVGDSRVYQLREGRKVFRTFDHSRVFEQVAEGKMTEEEARVNPRSNVLSRALGVLPDVEISIVKLPYRENDRFILCTDGVWNSMPELDVIKMLTENDDIEKTVIGTHAKVETIGKKHGGQHDNHTMIVVDMKTNSRYRKNFIGRLSAMFRRTKQL